MDIVAKNEKQDIIAGQNHIPVPEAKAFPNGGIYRLEDSGQYIVDFRIDAGLGKDFAQIAFVTDPHINCCDEIDEAEDPEVMHTKECRHWNANAASVPAIDRIMPLASTLDAVVIGGDILDYQSHGAAALAKEHLFARYPEALCAVGGHDFVKEMQTGLPERLPLEKRRENLASVWPNDIEFAVKAVKDRLLLVALNNTVESRPDHRHYTADQVGKMRDLIDFARKGGKRVLIFQHEPLSTGNPADTNIDPVWRHDRGERDFYSGVYAGSTLDSFDTDREMCSLITESADVVKGIVCGHVHAVFVLNVRGKDAGREVFIPELCMTANAYMNYSGIMARLLID